MSLIAVGACSLSTGCVIKEKEPRERVVVKERPVVKERVIREEEPPIIERKTTVREEREER
ncbi:MAG TPA: hypothetical protein VIL86_12170 [Tepidisphaeraceae bacterium]